MEANHNFYSELAEDCCNALEHIEVPVFQSKTSKTLTSNIETSKNLATNIEATTNEDISTREADAKEKLENLASLATKTKGELAFR